MNRRNFIKSAIAAGVAAAVPVLARSGNGDQSAVVGNASAPLVFDADNVKWETEDGMVTVFHMRVYCESDGAPVAVYDGKRLQAIDGCEWE